MMSNKKSGVLYLSPSRASTWVRCKKQYYWRYYHHLAKLEKSAPPVIGTIVGTALGWYYQSHPEDRSQEELNSMLTDAIEYHDPHLPPNDTEGAKEWQGIIKSCVRTLQNYHQWAIEQDKSLRVISVEETYTKELTPQVTLLAIPDAVALQDNFSCILEHKCRTEYRPGDFGIDYQSVACCLVAEAIGTMYNVLKYTGGKKPYIRDTYIRSVEELDYFTRVFISIGEDILSTPAEKLYPQPVKRCYCDFWELCLAEIQGVDIQDIIESLYYNYKEEEYEEKPGNSG